MKLPPQRGVEFHQLNLLSSILARNIGEGDIPKRILSADEKRNRNGSAPLTTRRVNWKREAGRLRDQTSYRLFNQRQSSAHVIHRLQLKARSSHKESIFFALSAALSKLSN